jgi:acetyl-CoA C-acetyltransferase
VTLRNLYGHDIRIAGWGHTRFEKSASSLEELIVSATTQAIHHAGIEPTEIDEIYLGNFNAGMNALAFPSSLALQADPQLWGKPSTRVENACASGSAAIHLGIRAILAGTARTVLVVGAEKMTERPPDIVGEALLGADYELAGQRSQTGFAQLFADVAEVYKSRYGDPGDTLAKIAAKSHRQGSLNPLAHLQKDLSEAFCRDVSNQNPIVAGMLRRTDCSPISDGAAAVVLTTAARTSSSARTTGVRIDGIGHANDILPKHQRDPLAFAATEAAWHQAMSMAGTDTFGLSFIELHDCFTIAELVLYEVLGVAARGRGGEAINDAVVTPTGSLPVNVSGGLKAKGHPVGATGVSQHVMAAMQLTNTAGRLQLPDPERGAVQNMGGLGIANYATVLSAA